MNKEYWGDSKQEGERSRWVNTAVWIVKVSQRPGDEKLSPQHKASLKSGRTLRPEEEGASAVL